MRVALEAATQDKAAYIIERGTHQELMQSKVGAYRRLTENQMAGELPKRFTRESTQN